MMSRLRGLIHLLNHPKCLSGLTPDDVPTTEGSESLYPRRVPPARTEPTVGRYRKDSKRNGLPNIQGRQLGVSFKGEKIHVLREVSYASDRFLCGAKKHPNEPLFVGTAHTDTLDLCGTCAGLVEKGAA